MAIIHFVQLCQSTHVKQQLAHTLALGIATFQEMFLLVLRHVGMVKDAFQVTMNAGGRCLQFVSGILRELALDTHLVLLRMTQFPIEHDDGVTDVAQLVVGQASLQFVV